MDRRIIPQKYRSSEQSWKEANSYIFQTTRFHYTLSYRFLKDEGHPQQLSPFCCIFWAFTRLIKIFHSDVIYDKLNINVKFYLKLIKTIVLPAGEGNKTIITDEQDYYDKNVIAPISITTYPTTYLERTRKVKIKASKFLNK